MFDIEEIIELNLYAVDTRYPDNFYMPSTEEAKQSFKLALKVFEFVKNKIKKLF